MHDELARVESTFVAQTGDEPRQHIVGYRDQHEVGIHRDLRYGADRHPRQQCLCPEPGEIRYRGYRDHLVSRASKCSAQHGTHTTRTDNPHAKAWPRIHVPERRPQGARGLVAASPP